jgi:thioredoxin reductase (NADPH)
MILAMEEKMSEVLDLVIVGAGPAGMTAAIYASRAQMKFEFLERSFAGGQITNTYEIENYPGIITASGYELTTLFREHVEHFGVEIKAEDVIGVELEGKIKKVITTERTLETKTIIFAMGSTPKKIGVPGEDEFMGRGISNCATCDGAFYKNRVTLVVGGGDVAVEDAIYLSRMCKKVYLVHRRDELRAVKVLQEKLFEIENIEMIWSSGLESIQGDQFVNKVVVKNYKTNELKELEVDGVFIAIGSDPSTKFLEGKVDMDKGGYIATSENCMTSVEGVFAAGDLRQKSLRQVITACGDGATSVFGAEHFI